MMYNKTQLTSITKLTQVLPVPTTPLNTTVARDMSKAPRTTALKDGIEKIMSPMSLVYIDKK